MVRTKPTILQPERCRSLQRFQITDAGFECVVLLAVPERIVLFNLRFLALHVFSPPAMFQPDCSTDTRQSLL